MREIKFRAWDNERQEMRFPFLLHSQTGTGIDIYEGGVRPNKLVLMQFTGLKDKNGKEIYEGDVLAPRWIVRWSERLSGFVIIDDGLGFMDLELPLGTNIKGEIIGNIYENPKLLAG